MTRIRMRRVTHLLLLAVFCGLLEPDPGSAQAVENATMREALVYGGLSGIALSLVYVNSHGEGKFVSDEAAIPLGLSVGLVGAFSAWLDQKRSPEGRGSTLGGFVGKGIESDVESFVALRKPLTDRLGVDLGVLVKNHSWQKTERGTRCSDGLLGGQSCRTGDFTVDHRYQQGVSLSLRGSLRLAPESDLDPYLTIGGGITTVHVDLRNAPDVRHSGGLGEVTLGIWHSSALVAEAGYRVLAGDVDGAIEDRGGYVRAGFTWPN